MLPHNKLGGNHNRKILRPAENSLSDGVQKRRMSPALVPQVGNGRRVVREDCYRRPNEMWSKPQESSLDGQELSDINRKLYFFWSPKAGRDTFVQVSPPAHVRGVRPQYEPRGHLLQRDAKLQMITVEPPFEIQTDLWRPHDQLGLIHLIPLSP